MKNVLKLVALFILIIGGGLGYIYSSTGEVRAYSSTFVGHISKNEFVQAYAMLHSNLREKISLDDFTRQITDNKVNTLVGVTWTGFSIKKNDSWKGFWKPDVMPYYVQSARGYITLKSGLQAKVNVKVAKLSPDVAYSIVYYHFYSINDEDEL